MDLKIESDMSEQKKFNVGDRVRLKEYYEFTCANELTYIDVDEVGIVKAVYGGYIKIDFSDMPVWLEFYEDKIELVESYNPKTAFLSELKALLEKYNASIYDYEQYKLCVDFDNGDSISWYWGNKTPQKSMLTADNIMDYEKE